MTLGSWQEKAVSGWSGNAIVNLQSGLSFTPQLGFSPSNNGNVIEGGPSQYFNPNAFIVYVAGTYDNLGRSVDLRAVGDSLRSFDPLR